MIGVLTFVWGAVAYLMRHRQTFLTVVIGSALTDAFNLYLGESVFSVAGGLGAVVLLHRRGIDATFARRAGPLFIVLALPVVVGFYFVAVEPFDDPYAAYRATTQQLGFKYVVQVLRIPEIALAAYAAYVGVSAHANPRGALLRSFSQLVTLVAVATAIDFLSGDALKALLFERTTDDRVTGLSVEPRQLAREMGLLLLTLLTVMSHRLRETRTRWLAFAAILLLLGTYSVSGLATTALVTFGYLVYRYPRDYRTNSLDTSLPRTSAASVIRFQSVATSSATSTVASCTSARLYQMLPDLMISSSRGLFQVPLMWTNLARSSKRAASRAVSLSAIHRHLSRESASNILRRKSRVLRRHRRVLLVRHGRTPLRWGLRVDG